MNKIELIKTIKTKTLERIIEKYGIGAGIKLTDMKLSIWDVRTVLYDECFKMAQQILEEEFGI